MKFLFPVWYRNFKDKGTTVYYIETLEGKGTCRLHKKTPIVEYHVVGTGYLLVCGHCPVSHQNRFFQFSFFDDDMSPFLLR
jgi:hypothetical protein